MPEKSKRRLLLESSLLEDPTDAFLRYGLAIQCLREGDLVEGRARLRALIDDEAEGVVAAYQQLGQSFAESGEHDNASVTLRAGIRKATSLNDLHAASEMEGLLETLG